MLHANAADLTVLWSTPDGVRCVVRPYDEDRFQLKLVREQGTIRSDLFARYTDAVEAAHEWRRRLESAVIQSVFTPIKG